MSGSRQGATSALTTHSEPACDGTLFWTKDMSSRRHYLYKDSSRGQNIVLYRILWTVADVKPVTTVKHLKLLISAALTSIGLRLSADANVNSGR